MSRRLVSTAVAAFVLSSVVVMGPLASPAAAAQAYEVPTQFIAKLYTEAFGIAPPAGPWANLQNYYLANPCTQASLASWGKAMYKSADFNISYPLPDVTADKHIYAARTVALFRGALNREPTQPELNSVWTTLINVSPQTAPAVQAVWNNIVDNVYGGAAFTSVAADICDGNINTRDPADFGWNNTQVEPVASMPHGTTCGLGGPGLTRQVLQNALNSAPPGGVVKLAQNATVWLDDQLVIPEGRTLTTCGPADDATLPDPIPGRYALQARLVRTWTRIAGAPDVTWPASATGKTQFDLPSVRLLRGAKLDRVWVDGNRNRSENNCDWGAGHALHRRCHNVVMQHADSTGSSTCPGQGPTDPPNCIMNTTVRYSRLDNSAGGTTLSHYGSTGQLCRGDTYITNNLITAYQSSHQNGRHIDGITVACQKSHITENVVIDATDVPIIVWRPCVNTTVQIPGSQDDNERACWNTWTDNRVQRTKVERNTVIAAGSSNWGGIWHTTGESTFPDSPVADFTGATIKDNHIYTSVAATMHALVVLGARTIAPPPSAAAHPDWTTRGSGSIVTNNDTNGQIAYVNVAVIHSGVRNVNLSGNHFDRTRVAFAGVGGLAASFPGWVCGQGALNDNERAPIIAEISSDQGSGFWASGTLTPNDATPTLNLGATAVVGGAETGCMRAAFDFAG